MAAIGFLFFAASFLCLFFELCAQKELEADRTEEALELQRRESLSITQSEPAE